jgi:hypothetical protein
MAPDSKRKRMDSLDPIYTEYMPNSQMTPMPSNVPLSIAPTSPVTLVPGSLEVRDVVRARGYLQFSDLRLKTNVNDIVDAVDIVSRLKGKTYEWKPGFVDREHGGKRVIGLIAQEVQKVLPEVLQILLDFYLFF